MQESIRNKENNTDVKGYKALFSFLPGIEEVADNGHSYFKGHLVIYIDEIGPMQNNYEFTISVESTEDKGNLSPQKVGSFQLYGDNLSKFNEECVNTISEANSLPKTEVFFMWSAPPPGSGCVTFSSGCLSKIPYAPPREIGHQQQ
ncbi:hypothetical protein NQ317_004504 [Molorchus minor]|uniref:Reelin domain-containing protein n=1 Tax=Molorchus minor TaxID=1323400 RepID=A0ABQ9JY63_9CUCU|nr:hypothetical protein NQ317_004504 [Molorchus minor]